MTDNVTDLLFVRFFALLQRHHCVCDVVPADNRVTLKYAAGPPSTDLHDYGLGDASQKAILRTDYELTALGRDAFGSIIAAVTEQLPGKKKKQQVGCSNEKR